MKCDLDFLARARGVLAGCTVAVALGLGPASADDLPEYDSLCGYAIVVSSTASVSQAIVDATGRQIIVLDPSLQRAEQRLRRQFLIMHECAHHRLGHVSPDAISRRRRSPAYVRDSELSADCWAAQTLAQLGVDAPVELMIAKFNRSGLYSPGGGYPAGVQRASIIQQCAHEGRLAAQKRAEGPNGTP